MNRKLAKITKAKLEIQERHILNFWIHVDYEDGFSQGVGGIALDEWSEDKKSRIGTAYGCEMIRRLLIELNVDDFSEMAGKHIWVHGEGESFSFKAVGIQALSTDNKESKAVIFSEVYKMFEDSSNQLQEDKTC